MTPEDIASVTQIATKFGIWKIKLTGGEPLLRDDVTDIIRAITSIRHVRQLSLVTNGLLLASRAEELKSAGLDFVAVSLPALDRWKYRQITRADRLDDVLEGIDKAHKAGLQVVLNIVLLNQLNIDEIPKLIDFAAGVNAIVKFIELLVMPSDEKTLRKYHYSPDLLEQRLATTSISSRGWSTGGRPKAHSHFELKHDVEAMVFRYPCNSRSCEDCPEVYDGLRLTSDGKLASCILRTDNHVDILSLIRSGASDLELERAFSNALAEIGKPPAGEVSCING
jgi:cyclic pyranopterin phosphate synthase